nr:melanotropin gamma1 [Bos taurus]
KYVMGHFRWDRF